jgi:hypothetical protein
MADAQKIAGDGGIPDVSPRNKKRMYEAEYKHAANLFDRSLEEYTHANNEYKKEAFCKVMNQALQVLKDTAAALKKQEWLQHCDRIEQDYQTFRAEGTPEAETRLHNDLKQVRKHLEK